MVTTFFIPSDYSEAKKVMRDIDLDIEEQGIEGSATITRLVDGASSYELYF